MSLFCIIRAYNNMWKFITWAFGGPTVNNRISYHILSDDYDASDAEVMSTVPEDAILIEEWQKDGVKKCNLFYEFETIERERFDPFAVEPEIPWLWIGDRKTEVDLTNAMSKYMVVGNVIALDLILHLIQVHHDTEIVYIDARTLEEVKFPAKGVEIVAKNAHTRPK
jgi:hypothetical protein